MAEDLSAADLGAPSSASDLGSPQVPAAPQTSSPLSASDLGAPNSSAELGQSQAASPIATPHEYDSVIRNAAQKYKIDERVLRAVGLQETGLGQSSNYNPATGKDYDQNKGRGLFQLDPSSGASQADLDRASKDPQFAADQAAAMISRNLKITNGDERKALAMYNAGIGNVDAGYTYADQVLSKAKNLDDPNYLPAQVQQVQKDFKTVQTQLKKGKSFGQALAHTKTFKPIAKVEGNGKVNWLWLQHHPIEGALNVLGAPQRALGGYEYSRAMGGTQKEAMQAAHDMVFNPTAKNQARSTWGPAAVINAFSEKYGHGKVIPTHEDVDKYINAHFNSAIAPHVSAVTKTGEDILLQTISDPTIGGHLIGGIFGAARGVLGAAHTLAQAHNMTYLLPHIPQAHAAAEALQDVFTARRDLDRAGFTPKGKKVRLAVENAALSRQTRAEIQDSKVLDSGHNSSRRFLQQVYEHGDRMHSNQAARYLGLTPHANPTGHLVVGNLRTHITNLQTGTREEREEILRHTRRQIANEEVRTRTEQHIHSDPSLFNGHPGTLATLGFRDTAGIMNHLYGLQGHTILGKMANWAKKTVMVNPAPHGLKNVGTLAYLAGGIPAVFHGLVGMAHGIDSATLKRLEDMGALPLYIDEGTSKWGKTANEALERMEQGWRAGLLKVLDEKLGPSAPGSVEEMLKGQMISEKIGDYRNQSAFVHALKALGGEFVAFRLGIAPSQVLKSVAQRPDRVTGLLRTKQDLQNNRSNSGKRRNRYVAGGPEEDVLRLLLDPVGFAKSPASTGAVSNIAAENPAKSPKGISDIVLGAAASWLPFAGPIINEASILGGNAMPGQKMSWADKVMATFSNAATGGYFQKEITPKQERIEAKKIRKAQGL